jgi:hypothetical protein
MLRETIGPGERKRTTRTPDAGWRQARTPFGPRTPSLDALPYVKSQPSAKVSILSKLEGANAASGALDMSAAPREVIATAAERCFGLHSLLQGSLESLRNKSLEHDRNVYCKDNNNVRARWYLLRTTAVHL